MDKKKGEFVTLPSVVSVLILLNILYLLASYIVEHLIHVTKIHVQLILLLTLGAFHAGTSPRRQDHLLTLQYAVFFCLSY
jgi:hypothetical protein